MGLGDTDNSLKRPRREPWIFSSQVYKKIGEKNGFSLCAIREPIPLIELDGVKSAGTTVLALFVAEFVIDDILLFLLLTVLIYIKIIILLKLIVYYC
jgi:hypothetical protein